MPRACTLAPTRVQYAGRCASAVQRALSPCTPIILPTASACPPRPLRAAPARAPFTDEEVSRIIEMAWEDRTPFESIAVQFGLSEGGVITLMRRTLQRGSFRVWRERVTGRATKHLALRSPAVNRAYCPTQYKHR